MFDDAGNGPHHSEINNKLTSMGAKCTIGREIAPSTGRQHYHVYAFHPKGFNTRNQKAFDIITYHPNIKLITSGHRRTWDYVVKGNDVPIREVERPEGARKRSGQLDEVFKSGLEQQTFDGMLRTIQDGAPARFATSYLNIRACAQDKFPEQPDVDYTHPVDATFNTGNWPELDDWVARYLPDSRPPDAQSVSTETPSLTTGASSDASSIFTGDGGWLDFETEASEVENPAERYLTPSTSPERGLNAMQQRPRSLILWGRSRTGKTCWARSLGKHAHHANTVNMELHSKDARYAVFDDISGGLSRIDYKAWLGGQLHFTITDKYKKKRTITWGKPCIYISNENPYDTDKGIDFDWLRANTNIVHIDSEMY